MTSLRWVVGLPMALIVSAAVAQQRQQPPPDAQDPARSPQRPGEQVERRGGPQPEQASLEGHVANCLILANQTEIALLRAGKEQSQNEELQQLAEKMVQDHEKHVQKLEQFASKQASELTVDGQDDAPRIRGDRRRQGQPDQPPQTEDRRPDTGVQDQRPDPRRDAGDRPGQPEAQQQQPDVQRPRERQDALGQDRNPLQQRGDARRVGRTSDSTVLDELVRLDKEAAQEFIRLVKEEFQEKEGSEFDKAFVSQQVGAHIGMLAKLKAAENVGSSEFQNLVREGQETAKEHKQQVKQLYKDVVDSEN